LLFGKEQKIFGQTIANYDENAHSKERKVVLSGFPYDEGTRRNGGRIGGSVAPKIFRQTLAKIELYAKEGVTVVDAGDIEEDLQL
jgi:arginase family enzyme